MNNLAEIIKTTLKHHPGEHDQKTHGNWASGPVEVSSAPVSLGHYSAPNLSDYNSIDERFYFTLDKLYSDDYDDARRRFEKRYPGESLSQPKMFKNLVVENLSQETGIDYETVNKIVHAWARSSNQFSSGVMIQEAVAEEFGLQLNPWQQSVANDWHIMVTEYASVREKFLKLHPITRLTEAQSQELSVFEEVNRARDEDIHAIIEGIEQSRVDSIFKVTTAGNKHYGAYDATKRRRFVRDNFRSIIEYNELEKDERKRNHDYDPPGFKKSEVRRVVRAMYNATQKKLAERRYKPDDTVTMYRGIEISGKKHLTREVRTMRWAGNVAESWSTNRSTAGNFGTTVIAASVPIKNILSFSLTGFGCFSESEVVTIDTKEGSEVLDVPAQG